MLFNHLLNISNINDIVHITYYIWTTESASRFAGESSAQYSYSHFEQPISVKAKKKDDEDSDISTSKYLSCVLRHNAVPGPESFHPLAFKHSWNQDVYGYDMYIL